MTTNSPVLIDNMIGTTFPIVRNVAENIEYVKHVSAHLPQIYRTWESVTAIDSIYSNISIIDTLFNNMTDLNTINDNISELLTIEANINPLLVLNGNTTQLFNDAQTIADFAVAFGTVQDAIDATEAIRVATVSQGAAQVTLAADQVALATIQTGIATTQAGLSNTARIASELALSTFLSTYTYLDLDPTTTLNNMGAGVTGLALFKTVAAKQAQKVINIDIQFPTVVALQADTELAYATATDKTVVAASDYVMAQGFRYQVATSGASDHHIITAGGVKLYVIESHGLWNIKAFGAKGNGKQVTATCSMSLGSNTLTATGASFTAADIGKRIKIPNCGSTGTGIGLFTTITAVASATSITVADNSLKALSPFSQVLTYGNDETAICNLASTAINAAGGGMMYAPPGFYLLSSPILLKLGVSLLGRAGAHTFQYQDPTAVTKFFWAGASTADFMLTNSAKWSASVTGIVLDGDHEAWCNLGVYSAGGATYTDVYCRNAKVKGIYMYTNTVNTCVYNTFIHVVSAHSAAIAVDLYGAVTSPVTHNDFTNCFFDGGTAAAMRFYFSADTNHMRGGYLASTGFALVVNTGDQETASLVFDNVAIIGPGSGYAVNITAANPATAGNNLVATFNDCFFGAWANFNAGSARRIKIKDSVNAGTFLGAASGDYGAVAAITVGASPYTYTNNDYVMEQVAISGGTISDISIVRNGITTSLGLTSGLFLLQPVDGLVVTYSGLPVMKKIPH